MKGGTTFVKKKFRNFDYTVLRHIIRILKYNSKKKKTVNNNSVTNLRFSIIFY